MAFAINKQAEVTSITGDGWKYTKRNRNCLPLASYANSMIRVTKEEIILENSCW